MSCTTTPFRPEHSSALTFLSEFLSHRYTALGHATFIRLGGLRLLAFGLVAELAGAWYARGVALARSWGVCV
jgi:hypothetical protein